MFFFSSRRRHTRSKRDWSSDVCSSDLDLISSKFIACTFGGINLEDIKSPECFEIERRLKEELNIPLMHDDQRSEERRVGKECRSRWERYQLKKKKKKI